MRICQLTAIYEWVSPIANYLIAGGTKAANCLSISSIAEHSTIEAMFNAEEQSRRATAQAANDVLYPSHFDVDLDCEDEE